MNDLAFEARNSPWRLRALGLAALGFVAIGAWIIAGAGDDVVALVMGGAGIAFFGPCAVVLLKRSFDTGVVLRINGDGVWAKGVPNAPVPWSEITGVHEYSSSGQQMIGIEARDLSRYRAQGLGGRLAGANRALTGVDAIWLTATGTDRNHAELAEAVARFRS